MPASATEISSIDFGGMIGKPLTAVVDAQAAAAMTTCVQLCRREPHGDRVSV